MPPGMDVNQQFVAEIINLPPTLIIYLDGQSVNQLKFLEILTKEKLSTPFITFHKDAAAFYDLALELLDDRLAIRDAKSKQLLHGVKTFVDQSVQYIVDALSQIARWKNLERMANKQSTIPAESFRFALQLLNVAGEWIDADGDDLTFDITKDRPEIPFRIKLANNSDTPYYFALYRLASTFMIEKHSKDNDASLIKKGEEPWLETNVNPGEDPVSFVLDNDDLNEETEIYKLVYSTDPFDDYFVSETRELKREIVDLPKTRGVRGIRKLSRSDWGTRMITIRLVRELQRVNETQGFSNNIISIKPHPSFKAAVSITPIDSAAKSYNPAKILEDIFDIDDFSIINLGEKSKSDAVPQQTVVELSDIGNEQVLENEPLEININYKLGDDEQVMAVTYSDGLVIPIGLLEKSGDSDLHVMKLQQAPAQMDPRREAGKNPVRALWFCFLKVVLKREDEVFKLRYIEYKNGKPYYPDEGVDDKIKNSTKILLIIHGIIGNTKSIAANMETFLKEGRYDCILSFDYENLNTSISGIAFELKKRLEKNGISQNKTIDIVAHSMGGLVTRYMIERLGGDVFVKRLFLVGTPNNGSAFGKLVTMRNWATGVLTLACNYGKQFLGVFGFFLDGVNKVLIATVPITNTLEQMGTGSDFLKDLNEDRGPVQTKYFILAGNTSQYLLNDDAAGKGLMEKIKLAIGKLAYWDVDNDIAVSVSSIKKIPGERAEKVVEMGCHHLNYFDYNPSIKTLREMMN
ncbi:MAG: hypothetical protein ABIQ56_04100, partial [Chitinophagaceae bacterium]